MGLAIGYHHWREEHRSTLESFGDKNVFLLFSGGKDSSLAMDFLLRAGKDFGFDFEIHSGPFPVHMYTDAEKGKLVSYWEKRGVNIIWHDLGVTDNLLKEKENPCLECQKRKKKMLKSILMNSINDWERLVLIAGYNLWDIVSYTLEHILNDFSSQSESLKNNIRFTETAQRFYPLLTMKEGYTVFRPLIKYNGSDIKKLIQKDGIPTLSIPCQFREFRPKKVLENYYQKMGIRFDYDRVFDFAKGSLGLPDSTAYTSIDKDEYLLNIF